MKLFDKIALTTARVIGKPTTFIVAVNLVIIWAVSGPFFNFSDTWQLIINTSTTICTFLIVFLIQNSQNRSELAIHAKLDEIIYVLKDARNELEHIEEQDEKTIESIRR